MNNQPFFALCVFVDDALKRSHEEQRLTEAVEYFNMDFTAATLYAEVSSLNKINK